MISCILLCAGESKRFGSPKATARINTQTIIERIQAKLIASAVGEIVVVTGHHRDQINPYLLNHKKLKVVYNKDHNFGQTSSFKRGLDEISKKVSGIMLWPVDYPFIKLQTIDRLVREFSEMAGNILIPVYENHKGHPPVFSASLKDEFLSLENSVGINTVSHKYVQSTRLLEVGDPGVVQTFNTREEFDRICSAL